MEADSQADETSWNQLDWIGQLEFRDPAKSREHLEEIWRSAPSELSPLQLGESLVAALKAVDDVDSAVSYLHQFLQASDDRAAMLSLFGQTPNSLTTLLSVFDTSATLAKQLVADPDYYHVLSANKIQRLDRQAMVKDLLSQFEDADSISRASVVVRRFYSQEVLRIAFNEFVRDLSPEKVGRQIAMAVDVIIEAALEFVVGRLAERRGMPQRPDGSTPEVCVIALGNLGGNEMGYSSPVKLVFLYDAVDQKNVWHRDFYMTVVQDVVSLLRGDQPHAIGIDLDLREGPRYEVGVLICGVREAMRIYETSGRIWQRLSFVKARAIAGSKSLGKEFIKRLEPWVYGRFLSRIELAEIRTLRHKLEKRVDSSTEAGTDIARAPGGRDDIELTVQFLQLLHGGGLPAVRCQNSYDAIVALERAGCLTHQESTLLSESYARLCRLQHQMSVMFDLRGSRLPEEPTRLRRLAWALGIRDVDAGEGDLEKFQTLLRGTFDKNRKVINHLMLDGPADQETVPVEMELILDPDPDPQLVQATMLAHGLSDPKRAMEDLIALSSETVPFLSPHRCRHFLSSIAPALLEEVSRTPNPDAALASLVEITDSLGAKATLWELLGNSRPTMELMVRLCATTPYLRSILVDSPGMIDELIDSLLMNRLPSAERLDAHSIELCRGAADIDRILRSFKSSAHLTIGVRDMLGKETLEATHQAIGDTAEATLRRVIKHEQEALASQYGDPVDEEGNAAELLTLGLGKLGGREPNYHSDLDAIFLYSADGETQRRVGGHRRTLSNQLFFNQLAQRVLARINQANANGRLYELDSRLRMSDAEGLHAMQLESFLERFHDGSAPLWQRFAICKARTISGSRFLRKKADEAVANVISGTVWTEEMTTQIRDMRLKMEETARPENLKRGVGGTADVEYIAQMLTLRHARERPDVISVGTTASLERLAEFGFLDEKLSLKLIQGYRTLRRIEACLRLMNTEARHEIPEDQDSMKNLAYLMNESDPAMIVASCQRARQQNREIFNQVFAQG